MPIITPSNSEESKIEFSPPKSTVDFLLNYSKATRAVALSGDKEVALIHLN